MSQSKKTSSSTRRGFIKSTAATGAAMVALPAIAKSKASPADRIRVGLLGMGNRMTGHLQSMSTIKDENFEIVAVCDCDQSKADSVKSRYPFLADKKLKTYNDTRALLDDKSIDAVDISTPDHWHALGTIWACQAGKDVYVEKPGAHNVFEAKKMLEAARKYNCMVQHGTQCRSSSKIRNGIQKLKEGIIGDVYMGRAISYKLRGHLGKHAPRPVPKGLDWDAWTGPAEPMEFSNFRHRRWHWQWNTGSGEMGVQAIHQLDILRWGMGLDTHPSTVQSAGGIFVQQDSSREVPDNQATTYLYGDKNKMVTFEHRSWITSSEADFRDPYPFVQPDFPVGAIFFGSKGYMTFPDFSSYHTYLGTKRELGPTESVPGSPISDAEHFQNWFGAIRSRKVADLNADIEEGYKSLAMTLLANVSCRLGRTIHMDPETLQCPGDEEANKLIKPPSRAPYTVPEVV